MMILTKDLLTCPFCGAQAYPIIVVPAAEPGVEPHEFWGDRERVSECERAGCVLCGISMSADAWQRRARGHSTKEAITYDTRADAPIAKVTLNNGEMWLLIEFYLDGYCPICGDSINQGHHLCSSCAAEESRIWAGYGY